MEKFKYNLLLHLIILMWGMTGILGKVIELTAVPLVWYRVFIAAVALMVFMWVLKRPFKTNSSKDLIHFCLVGVLVGLHWVTFYHSIHLSTASLGILCLSTTTIHVAWLEPIIMKRPFSWLEMVFSLTVIMGIYFVAQDFDHNERIALFYGLASALFAASFAVFNAKFVTHTKPSVITLYEMIAAFIFTSILLAFNVQGGFRVELFALSTEDVLWLLFLGVLCTSFAFLATIEVVKHLGAFSVSLSINLEPVYTIVLAALILKEHKHLNTDFYIGATVIVLVVLLNGFIKSKYFKQLYSRFRLK